MTDSCAKEGESKLSSAFWFSAMPEWKRHLLTALRDVADRLAESGYTVKVGPSKYGVLFTVDAPDGQGRFSEILKLKYDHGLPGRQMLNRLVIGRMFFAMGSRDQKGPIITFDDPRPESLLSYKFYLCDEDERVSFVKVIKSTTGYEQRVALNNLFGLPNHQPS